MISKKLRVVIAVAGITAILAPTVLAMKTNAKEIDGTKIEQQIKADFGVGQGVVWPEQVNAPYVDMVAWINQPEFSSNGAMNLSKIAKDTGVKFFNLGFIQSTGGVENGKVAWGWGGYRVLSESNKDDNQYKGIKNSIRELREMGGDVTISFGGLNGVAPWQTTQDVNVLANTYKEIVDGYGLTRLDLDIEGGAQNYENNVANAKAIKQVQKETGVDVVLTLPVLPSGLTGVQLNVLKAYLEQGVDLERINIMTMCYGNSTLLPGENYGTASLRAVDSTKDQLKEYFKKYANVTLSDAQAYRKLGTTPSIGYEGGAHPIFTTEWSKLVVDHAKQKGIGMTSFWSMNRDTKTQANQGVNNQYEFTNIFKQFGSTDPGPGPGPGPNPDPEVNEKPVLSGVTDVTIKLGESFDKLKGVKATDKEDGDITSKIKVSGNVDTNKAGKYTLTYSITDSKGLTTTQTRVVTVKENDVTPPPVTGDTYDNTKVYNTGDVVVYKGVKYTAKWWVQGESPDKSAAWEREKTVNPDGSLGYIPGSVYNSGDTVSYNGKTYKAKWWTNSVPGSDESWEIVK